MASIQGRSDFNRLPDYLKKPVEFLLKFRATFVATFKADPELLIRNPNFLSPQIYAAACVTTIVTVLKTAWPDDPVKSFQYPSYFSGLAPILEIIPLPLFTFAAAWLLLTSLPMYFVTKVLDYKPRLFRIYHATAYSQFTVLTAVTLYHCLILVFAEPLSGYSEFPFDKWPVLTAGWIGTALVLYCAVISVRLLAKAHGMNPWRFFIYNFLAVGLPIGLLDAFASKDGPERTLVSLFQPRPIQMYSISSGSMWPTLPTRSRIITNQLLGPSDYRVGDLIVFDQEGVPWIKRIVARGGETVQMKDGRLYINDALTERTFTRNRTEPGSTSEAPCYVEKNGSVTYEICELAGDQASLDNTDPVMVPDDHFFVLGDNRDNSTDSRLSFIGFIPASAVYGKAYFGLFPRSLGYLYKAGEPASR